jgi:hypothetical protein
MTTKHDLREEMREMGHQPDSVREALRRMIAEFYDYHYMGCPADEDKGPCNCFAGHLLIDAAAALRKAAS